MFYSKKTNQFLLEIKTLKNEVDNLKSEIYDLKNPRKFTNGQKIGNYTVYIPVGFGQKSIFKPQEWQYHLHDNKGKQIIPFVKESALVKEIEKLKNKKSE